MMRQRSFSVVAGVILALVLLTGACSAGYIAGRVTPSASYTRVAQGPSPSAQKTEIPEATESGETGTDSPAREPQPTLTSAQRDKLFAAFWQAWDLVHEQFVDQPVDDQVLMRGAIRGMLDALGDQHTSYLDPVQLDQTNKQLQGDEYEGIGAWVDIRGEYLTIISPMPGSPAEKAGLEPGDAIVAVDGEDMTGIDAELVRQKVIGPKGSTVDLTIRRKDVEDVFEVKVTRGAIVVPTIDGRMLASQIAYVHLFTFGDNTAAELHDTLKGLLDQKPAGLILDLRGNGGGYLETAIDVASEFIGDGVIMYEEYGDGSRVTYEAREGGLATKIPMVVLINEGSASASEIVAGAIRDRGRGKLVGMTSFGKGSVQNFVELLDNQGAVRVTIARWLTPSGVTIHEVGLEPDVTVEITKEDSAAGRDPQLDKAVELLAQP